MSSYDLDKKYDYIKVPISRDGHGHTTPVIFRKVKRTARLPQRTRPMVFASLHHHSTFSYGDGYALPSAHARRAAEIEMDALVMTEHGNVSSHVQHEYACKKEGVKPMFGVELYTGQVGENATQRKNHLTVIAENQEGYRNLLRLVSETFSEGFYYEPTASGPMLQRHKEGLVVLSGCQGSALFTALVGGKHVKPEDASYDRAKRVASQFKRALDGGYYIELQAFPELEATRAANPLLVQIAEELKIPYVVTFDCHYTIPEEKEMQKILHNLRPGERRTIEEMAREWGYDSNLCPPWTDGMIVRKLIATGLTRKQAIKAILNTREVAERCNVELPNLPMVRFPLPPGYDDSKKLWRDWIKDGWNYRNCDRLPADEKRRYKERLWHEVKVIEDKDFHDYFLIISDLVRWGKDHDVAFGPARGSAAGSLVCWLLRITEVNPMLFDDLVFERFIDVTRKDLPDIDIDCTSERRGQIHEYLVAKYGVERVSNVGTFTKFKGRNSLDAAARVFHVPTWEIDRIKEVLIERSSGDLRAGATIEDTAEQFPQAREVFERHPDLGAALDLEGNYSGFGVHSGGLVISTGPITEVAAFYEREVKGVVRRVISMDKYDAEKKGLLKIDLLGLQTTAALDNMRRELGWSLDDMYKIPLEDPEVIQGFRDNDVIGVFQFEGRACRYVNGALKPDNFKEIYDVTALARPGPLHNGAANDYIDAKWGRKEPEFLHEAVTAICGSTYGQIVYQEQILRILGEVFDFDWTHRAEVRRIITKKYGDQEFNRRWEMAREGALRLHEESGMTVELAKDIWGRCITAGSYAFNASHAVAYGMTAVYTMYFKRKYPEIFYKCVLNVRDSEGQKILLRDTQRFGRRIPLLPPHPAYSTVKWTRTDKGALAAGFDSVPGIGERMGGAIVAHRETEPIEDWDDLLKVKGIGIKKMEAIREFSNRGEDPFGATWLDRAITAVTKEIVSRKLKVPKPNIVSTAIPYSKGEDIECVWLGSIATRNERDLFEFNQAKGAEVRKDESGQWWIGDRLVKDPHLDKWVVMVGDDETDQIGLRVDRWTYPRLRKAIWKIRPGKDLVLIRGVKPGWMPTRQLTIHELWIIDPEVS